MSANFALATVLSPGRADKTENVTVFMEFVLLWGKTDNKHIINERDNNRALEKIHQRDVVEVVYVGTISD